MKMLLTGIAAALMATAATAQMSQPADPAAPPAPMGATPPADATGAPPAGAASAPAGETAMLTKRDGKWYSGDREATKEEVAEHKKSMKAGNPG